MSPPPSPSTSPPPPPYYGDNIDWNEKPLPVYIQDKYFAWLPAKLLRSHGEGSSATATVELCLPQDWHDHTLNSKHITTLQSEVGKKNVVDVDAKDALEMKIEESKEKQNRMIRTEKLSNYNGYVLPMQNVNDEGNFISKSDMSELFYFHQAAILYNLRYRHIRGMPYSRVGDIVVAVNPYNWNDDLYSYERQKSYCENLIWNDKDISEETILEIRRKYEPHVYETSCFAYRIMALEKKNQTILVSGVSGAGKTETVKIIMNHLATLNDFLFTSTNPLNGGRDESITPAKLSSAVATTTETSTRQQIGAPVRLHRNNSVLSKGVVTKILASNPIFEAFGNAKTLLNENSSRFGKFTKLHFNAESIEEADKRGVCVPEYALVGSNFETYLLEKSRVVARNAGEKTYHIFYQFLGASNDYKAAVWDELEGRDAASFRYIGGGDSSLRKEIKFLTDNAAWENTKEALNIFNISGENLTNLMRALCVVMQIGNITFSTNDSNEDAFISSTKELASLSELMGIPMNAIEAALTSKIAITRGEEIKTNFTGIQASVTCDSLAKEIYAGIFRLVVDKINETLYTKKIENHHQQWIGLLDLFGFEQFNKNRYEQLCINYANEKLQQKYIFDNFKSVQEEYLSEGIEYSCNISCIDNTDCLGLLESRVGILGILDEECVRPDGNDTSFVYKIKVLHGDSPSLVGKKIEEPYEFSIKHFAGQVCYDASGFVERNSDALSKDALVCASKCPNPYIKSLALNLVRQREELESKPRRRRNATVGFKFKTQLNDLLKQIASSRTSYVRCIKPNEKKLPRIIDHAVTMRQLASAGLDTAITISRDAFPNRLPFKTVCTKFSCLLGCNPASICDAEAAEEILSKLLKAKEKVVKGEVVKPYLCGKTKVFFRPGALELLEIQHLRFFASKAAVLQKYVRGAVARWKYKAVRSKTILLQSFLRANFLLKQFRKMRAAVIILQCWFRFQSSKLTAIKVKKEKSSTLIQSVWRGHCVRKHNKRVRAAIMMVKRMIQGKKEKNTLTSSLHTLVKQARKDNETKILLEKLNEIDDKSKKDDLLKECASMINYLHMELYRERRIGSKSRHGLIEANAKLTALNSSMASMKGALTASRYEVTSARKLTTQMSQRRAIERQESTNLSRTLNSMRNSHNLYLQRHKKDVEQMQVRHEEEINKLREKLQKERKKHLKERLSIQTDRAIEKRLLREEIEEHKQALIDMQESHHNDISHLMKALEESHLRASRNAQKGVTRRGMYL